MKNIPFNKNMLSFNGMRATVRSTHTTAKNEAFMPSFDKGIRNGDRMETYIPSGVQITGNSIDWYRNAQNNYGR